MANSYYCTKKRVKDFIQLQTKRLKVNNSELRDLVDNVLVDLKSHPKDNSNQIRFYNRVYETLCVN